MHGILVCLNMYYYAKGRGVAHRQSWGGVHQYIEYSTSCSFPPLLRHNFPHPTPTTCWWTCLFLACIVHAPCMLRARTVPALCTHRVRSHTLRARSHTLCASSYTLRARSHRLRAHLHTLRTRLAGAHASLKFLWPLSALSLDFVKTLSIF